MTDYKIGDLIQHKTGDIGIVVGFVEPGEGCPVYRVLVHWFDEDGLEPSALPESATATRHTYIAYCTRLIDCNATRL